MDHCSECILQDKMPHTPGKRACKITSSWKQSTKLHAQAEQSRWLTGWKDPRPGARLSQNALFRYSHLLAPAVMCLGLLTAANWIRKSQILKTAIELYSGMRRPNALGAQYLIGRLFTILTYIQDLSAVAATLRRTDRSTSGAGGHSNMRGTKLYCQRRPRHCS